MVKQWKGPLEILVDVVRMASSRDNTALTMIKGTGDNFYKQGQLLPENFIKAAEEAGHKGVNVRFQPDYDHSYYFMASFADEHVAYAAKHLGV